MAQEQGDMNVELTPAGDCSDDGARKSDRIRAEIDQTRARMDQTVDELQYRLSPRTIAHRAAERARHSAVGQTLEKASNFVREHPVPCAIIAAGLGLAAVKYARRHRASDIDDDPYYKSPAWEERARQGAISRAASKVKEGAGNAVEKVQHAGSYTMGKVHEIGEHAKDAAATAAHKLRDSAKAVGGTVQHTTVRARESFEHAVEDYPLAVGAAFFTLGLAGGLVIPRTRAEEKMLGPVGEKVRNEAEKVGAGLLERGEKIAGQVIDRASEALDRAKESASDAETSRRSAGGGGEAI